MKGTLFDSDMTQMQNVGKPKSQAERIKRERKKKDPPTNNQGKLF